MGIKRRKLQKKCVLFSKFWSFFNVKGGGGNNHPSNENIIQIEHLLAHFELTNDIFTHGHCFVTIQQGSGNFFWQNGNLCCLKFYYK